MRVGILCLLAETDKEAARVAKLLDDINLQRRDLETQIKEDAWLNVGDITPMKKTICLYQPDWHAGVVGIVAGRIKEAFHRPCLVFAPDSQGKLKGSGRSIPGIHLRDVLDLMSKKDPSLMLTFGGHAMAAGVSLEEDSFSRFVELFERVVSETADSSLFEPTIEVDGSLRLKECSIDFLRWVESSIWGQGFSPPIFSDFFTVVDQRLLQGKHLRLTLQSRDYGEVWPAIWFGQEHFLDITQVHTLAYQPQINRYQNQENLQLNVLCALESNVTL
jgi:single-stranded-DNA-specific exonuclease